MFVSKRIISISNSTKNDIVRHYKFTADKVYTTQLSHDVDEKDLKISANDVRRVKKRHSIVDDYVLYLGTLKPSKNIEGLIKAYSLLGDLKAKYQLVIAGKKGWMFDSIIQAVERLGLGERVVFTDYVTEADKMALRHGARVFVQPSFWEGFGIDTLSAMYLGIPVVVSDAGSLPEVVGKAGVVVQPKDVKSIAEGIKKVLLMSQKEYNKQVEAGKIRAGMFSWEDTARETLKIIEGAAK